MDYTKNVPLLLVVALLVGGTVGYSMGKSAGAKATENRARASLERMGVVQPQASEQTSLAGSVVSVAADSFVVEERLRMDPFATAPQVAKQYTVKVAADTVYFSRAMNLAPTGANKSLFTDKPIKLSDLRQGDSVAITAEANFLGQSELAAKTVVKDLGFVQPK